MVQAEFYEDGTVAASVMKEVPNKLEKAIMAHLGVQITTSLGRKAYERWSWEAWTKTSPAFLLSPPDHFRYMKDPHYQIAMSTYLGQLCLAMAPVVGRFLESREQDWTSMEPTWWQHRYWARATEHCIQHCN